MERNEIKVGGYVAISARKPRFEYLASARYKVQDAHDADRLHGEQEQGLISLSALPDDAGTDEKKN